MRCRRTARSPLRSDKVVHLAQHEPCPWVKVKGRTDLVLDCFERRHPAYSFGNRKQHVGVAGFTDWAVTREIAPAKLPLGVLDGDGQPTRDQIVVVATNRLLPTELQGVGVAPLGRPSHDRDARGKLRSLTT